MRCEECGREYSLHPRTIDEENYCWQCVKSGRVDMPEPDETHAVTIDSDARCQLNSIADANDIGPGEALSMLLRRAGY